MALCGLIPTGLGVPAELDPHRPRTRGMALPGCHTQARSLDELMERTKEAIALCLEVQGMPPTGLDFVGVQRIRVA